MLLQKPCSGEPQVGLGFGWIGKWGMARWFFIRTFDPSVR